MGYHPTWAVNQTWWMGSEPGLESREPRISPQIMLEMNPRNLLPVLGVIAYTVGGTCHSSHHSPQSAPCSIPLFGFGARGTGADWHFLATREAGKVIRLCLIR